ncbi:MAG: PQQ-binding-like beta-propeller repeat protein [Deltaproteobacteria bacterium]|nr:PQQ-binding-like beta-propeller repeat protein [Deltaproteobacteria bacterium]
MKHRHLVLCLGALWGVVHCSGRGSTLPPAGDAGEDTQAPLDTGGPGTDTGATDRPTPTDAPGTPTRTAITQFGVDGQRTLANRAETALSPAALRAGGFGRDMAFRPMIEGQVYAQPLYMPAVMVGGAPRSLLFVATQSNNVYGLDALTGAEVWRVNLGTPVSRSSQPCGNVSPSTGVLGTPVIDPASNTLYAVSFNASGGAKVFNLNALDLATGAQRGGYPAAIRPPMSNGSSFDPNPTGERGALLFLNGHVYVPFGGLFGDCGYYHGWVVDIDAAAPETQVAFGTPGSGSGIWAPAGLSTDGMGNLFVSTGNSMRTRPGGATQFGFMAGSLGEFVLRLRAPGLAFSMGDTSAQFSPSDAVGLDNQDADIGSVAPVVLPGTGAMTLLFQGGKEGAGYILNAAALGGPGGQLSEANINQGMYGAVAAWSNGTTTYVFAPVRGRGTGCTGSGGVQALRLQGTTLAPAWCTASLTNVMPAVSSNGNEGGVLWVAGASAATLRAYDIADGMEVYNSQAEAPTGVAQWVPPVVADGRVYVTGRTSVSMYRMR